MKIIYDTKDFTGRRAVVALGMFDGAHIGHQALIRRTVALAAELEAQSVVCTFDRHPLSVICPERAPSALLPLNENLEKFGKLGAEWALVQSFTPEYAATDAEAFLRDMVRGLRVAAIVAGENYTFGVKGRGDAALIRGMAGALGYRAEIVPPVMDGDVMCSSTRIRQLLRAGETEHARRLLRIEGDGTGDRLLYFWTVILAPAACSLSFG